MDRMQRLIKAMRALIEDKFSGYIKINFSQGSLGRVEKCEEFEDAASVVLAERSPGRKAEVIEDDGGQ